MSSVVACPVCGCPVVDLRAGGVPKKFCSPRCRRRHGALINKDHRNALRAQWRERNRDKVNRQLRERYHRPEVKAAVRRSERSKRLGRRLASSRPDCAQCGGPIDVVLRFGKQSSFCSDACRKANRKEYYRRWVEENREHVKASSAERRAKWIAENPDYFKKHYSKHRDRKKRQSQEWYQANAELAAQRQREYNSKRLAENPEHVRAIGRRHAQKRRAIKRDVFVENVDPRVVFERDEGICGICKKPVDQESDWHVDHIVPLSKRGRHAYDNVQLSHGQCNRKKGARVA